MEMQSIAGKETKKHIAAALKTVFPGMRFSLRSDYNSVYVSWTDGSMVSDVQRVMNRFESYTLVLDFNDRYEPTGYEWDGGVYLGPNYLNTTRQLSEERKAAIVAYMDKKGGKCYADALGYERVEAERELIDAGILVGFEAADRPDLMLDERPTEDRRVKKKARSATPSSVDRPEIPSKFTDNVVELFPRKSMDLQSGDSLSPEQLLKLSMLKIMFKEDLLQPSGMMIDEAFAFVANEVYGSIGGS